MLLNMNVIINSIPLPALRSRPTYETIRVVRHSPQLVEVVAWPREARDGVRGFQPGDKIKVDVGGAMRSYTPTVLTESELRFVGVVHGGGPASDWLERLRPGEPIRFMGPARSLPSVEGVEWAGFFGDETTIGAANALLSALPSQVQRFGALEVDEGSVDAVHSMSLGLATLQRGERGEALLRRAEMLSVPKGRGVVWLAGEATTLVELKKTLLERGFERSTLRIKAYWSVKGTLHRKALERGALR